MRDAYLVDDTGQDNLADVHPEIGFEFKTALAIEQEVLSKTGPILSESS